MKEKGTLRHVDITTYKVEDNNMSEVMGVVGRTYPVGELEEEVELIEEKLKRAVRRVLTKGVNRGQRLALYVKTAIAMKLWDVHETEEVPAVLSGD